MALLPASADARLTRVPAVTWRWLSVAECVWARAIALMIKSDGQDKQVQDMLRCEALTHLVRAAQCGSTARRAPLVLARRARALWNVGLPMMGSSVPRRALFGFTKAMLGHLADAGERDALAFRVQLFVLLFECYADRAGVGRGPARVHRRSRTCPPTSLQRPLWQWRVVFMSKLGKSVLDGMAKMKESDAVLQARVWATLARAATDRRQQLSAYSKAVDTLEGHFERARLRRRAVERGCSRTSCRSATRPTCSRRRSTCTSTSRRTRLAEAAPAAGGGGGGGGGDARATRGDGASAAGSARRAASRKGLRRRRHQAGGDAADAAVGRAPPPGTAASSKAGSVTATSKSVPRPRARRLVFRPAAAARARVA